MKRLVRKRNAVGHVVDHRLERGSPVNGEIDVAAAGRVAGIRLLQVDRTKTWFDPFIGARASVPAGRKWLFLLRADIGGFGVGSNFAWQIYPVVSYRFSNLFGLSVAYRVLSMDYESGNGTDLFKYDVTTFGPEIGLLFHF